ncbi:MAG: cytochrome b/b6 domain-containing protein [Desulfovibrio sp.]|jgi:cytochrome b subunit of formate dehydrogenase|nr:cytochrome b/b6 domain-containing protein [Desulfovibrio sp.]
MEQPERLGQSKSLSLILDENFSPVARMRLFSEGVRPNNRLVCYAAAAGDRGCLTCGNCIDACPVVREKQRFEFRSNWRTSMALENIVGEECRRCYRCVRACPQVTPDVKEYVTGFRRAEKFVHAVLATMIFTLMTTGIFLYHYKADIPVPHAVFYGILHRLAAVFLILVPLIYWKVDKEHFRRLIKNAWRSDSGDAEWLKQFATFLRHPFRDTLPSWTEFNVYHKWWIRYLCVALPILVLTGLCNFFSFGTISVIAAGIHSLVALCTDLLILLHLYFKLLRWLSRNIADMLTSWRKNGNFHYPFLYASKEAESVQAHAAHH